MSLKSSFPIPAKNFQSSLSRQGWHNAATVSAIKIGNSNGPLHHVLLKIWGEDPGPYYNLWYEPLIQVTVAYILVFTIERWWRKKVKEFFMKGDVVTFCHTMPD